MTIRTTTKTITFKRSFALSDVEGFLPPGDYKVEADEEMIDGLSFLAWRRVATVIHVRSSGGLQVIKINPIELDAALTRDGSDTLGFTEPHI